MALPVYLALTEAEFRLLPPKTGASGLDGGLLHGKWDPGGLPGSFSARAAF